MSATRLPRLLGLCTSMVMAVLLGCTFALSVASCEDGDATDAGDAGADARSDVVRRACPDAAPYPGSSCSLPGVKCEFGGVGDRHSCSTVASCETDYRGDWWVIEAIPVGCGDARAPAPSSQCAATFDGVTRGAACTPETSTRGANTDTTFPVCIYPEGTCTCGYCVSPYPGDRLGWACQTFAQPADCPAVRPYLGSACTQEGKGCPYGTDCESYQQPAMVCHDGQWHEEEKDRVPCNGFLCWP